MRGVRGRSLCSVFIAGGLWCSTVNGLCSVSSPSSFCFGTRSWPGDLSDWASAKAADASLCWCKRWRRTPSPVPWSDTWSMDISSCASSGRLEHNKRQSSSLQINVDPLLQQEVTGVFLADKQHLVVYVSFGVQVFPPKHSGLQDQGL